MSVRLYDLLGIDPGAADQDTQAAALWPNDVANATEGINLADDSERIVRQLQAALTFDDVRPGVDKDVQLGTGPAGQITLAASMHVDTSGPPLPTLYLRKLPNIGIQLLPTGTDTPATIYFASDGRGHELLVEGLPVELQLPPGLVEPDKDGVISDGNPLDFDANDEDSLAVVKQRDPQPTLFRTHVRLHLTPEKDVILEPNVPVSVDGAKLSGFPVEAIHDVVLIPSPNRREYFEWARNDLGSFIDDPPAPGAFGFRSISLDLDKPPFAALKDRFRDRSGVHSEDVDIVLEDIVFPVTGLGFPIPSHGTFGLRRKITDRNSIAQAFSLQHAPFRLRIYTRDGDANTQEGLYLFVDQLLFKTGTTGADTDEAPVVELNAGIVWQGDHGSQTGGTVGIGDDWLLQAGLTLGDQSPLKLTIAGAAISLHALRGGIRLRQIGDGKDSWQVLGDLSIKDSDPHGGSPAHSAFRITTLTGRPLDVILRDVGWSFGHVQLGKSIAAPEGVQLIFGGVVRLIVEEMGWVEEPGGGTYFSFSGGVTIGFGGGDDTRPTSNRDEKGGNGAGIRFRRLRFLTSDTPNAPPFKLDGIFLELHYGPVGIAGFGYVSDDVDAGFRYEEFGFGVKVEFPALAVTLSLAAEFLKGSRHPVAGGDDGAFSYFLASLQVGYIPAGPVGLYAVRVLVAYNMQPNLDPPGDNGESMVLYQWHKDHDAAIDMPRSRNLADWKPVDHSFAGGVGLGFSINSCGALFHIGAFLLLTHSDEDTLILVVGDVYLLKNPEPIAFAAIEYDFKKEKFGLMAGVDLSIDKFVGGASIPHFLRDIARLSGTIYFGNDPWSLAIGHLADQRSWLGIRIDVPLLDIKLVLAVGLELTDGGPKGFGVVFAFSGGDNWGIGAFIVFGSFGFIIGTWKTGSDSSGIHAWAQIGFKIHVFYVFHFGADIGVDITYLGKHPWYTTLAAQIHIDTPWFLPDVTFRFEKSWGESLPFDTSTITQALSSGSASSPQAPGNDGHAALLVPPLSDGNADPARLYSFNALSGVSGAALEDLHGRDDLQLVAVDADVSIEFTNPVANDAAIATDTFTASGGDPGAQQVQDMTVRYALKSVSIKRSPRFGPGAGTWTDLVAAADTELDISGGGSVHALPAVSFRWDADSRADGVLAPKRLLLNCRTPYSLVVGSPRNDDEAVAADPGFPCCQWDRRKGMQARWHWLEFEEIGAGARLPGQEQFSDGGDWWQWPVPPVTINGSGPSASGHVVAFADARDGIVGAVELSSPAFEVLVDVDTSLLDGSCVIEGYRGLTLVAAETVDASSPAQQVTLRAKIDAGFTRVVLRCTRDGRGVTGVVRMAALNLGSWPRADGLEVVSIGYLTCAEARLVVGRFQRCHSGDDLAPAVGGGGKLAFLPNHDYAVTAAVEVTVSHKTGGSKTLTLSQPAYFRTKGLVGLNASPNVGDELRPYVAATYPAGPGVLLYREEPVSLAFDENMSNLLPVDRVPAPGDPPEKAQLMELTLTIERLASTEGAQRLTVPSNDWLDAHGGVIIIVALPALHSGGFVRTVVRRASSFDPRVLRFERVLDAGKCAHDPLHSSQVLLHEPIGPDGTAGLWEPQTGFRATVRGKDGPYTQRRSFQLLDLGAFDYLADGGSPDVWSFDSGGVVANPGGRQYAAFGDPTWNHLEISTRIEPNGAVAGVAVGVSGSTPVQQAILALVDGGNLVVVRRTGGVDHELARSALPAGDGPVDLHVTAFDDRLRAQVGDVVVEGDRGPVRDGRAALVAGGPARFDTLLVDALDMYQVAFHTSRYRSFVEHVSSHEETVAAHPVDAMGAPAAATAAQVLAASGGAIATEMAVTADPQAREALFAKTVSDLGLAQLERCDRLTFTRLVDGPLTTALLLESPEPISFLHDVTLTLLHRTWHYQPWWDGLTEVSPDVSQALRRMSFESGLLVGPPQAVSALRGEIEIVHVGDGKIDVYGQPAGQPDHTLAGELRATLDADAARRAGFSNLVESPAGTIAALRPDRSIAGIALAPWHHGSWVHQDDPVAFTLLANGDETRALVLPAAGLASGTYILDFVLDRSRWQSATADPEASYHQEVSVELTW